MARKKKASRRKPTRTPKKKPAAKHSPSRRTFLKGAVAVAADKATDGAVAVAAAVLVNRLLTPAAPPPGAPSVREVATGVTLLIEAAGGIASSEAFGTPTISVEPSA